MASPVDGHDAVLDFWFREIDRQRWWAKDPAFDAAIRARFGELLDAAARGGLAHWRGTPRGRLAEVLVLDQFSRNAFRDTPRAFAQDPLALELAQAAVAAGALRELAADERAFLLMPYMHSESRAVHEAAVPLFREFTADGTYRFELRHQAIIERFGRYPHRNAVLGRPSTPEEAEFLAQPGSGF
jgi:uncharacterized protein (DUF924 family)